jgi:hypothetical protein
LNKANAASIKVTLKAGPAQQNGQHIKDLQNKLESSISNRITINKIRET